jgi:starch phosphorylase
MKPEELMVEVYYGKMNDLSGVSDSSLFLLDKLNHSGGGVFRFSGEGRFNVSGEIGFKIRVTPFHVSMVCQTELNLVKWG